jgi:hypothetical protein
MYFGAFSQTATLVLFAVKHEAMVYKCISVLDCICSYKISTFNDYILEPQLVKTVIMVKSNTLE